MIRTAALALAVAACCLGGCTNPKQATYSCGAEISSRMGPPRTTVAAGTDAAGDRTCE